MSGGEGEEGRERKREREGGGEMDGVRKGKEGVKERVTQWIGVATPSGLTCALYLIRSMSAS